MADNNIIRRACSHDGRLQKMSSPTLFNKYIDSWIYNKPNIIPIKHKTGPKIKLGLTI
jgi:hypothetical protein